MSDGLASAPAEYFEALYQSAPFGYLITDEDDVVVRVNKTLLEWGGYDHYEAVGQPFRSLLAPGSQLLYETKHLPILRLQGSNSEVALQLARADGTILPVLINAASVLNEQGDLVEVRMGVLDATSRVSYERELLAAQRTAESLAVRVALLQDATSRFATSSTEVALAESLATILEEALVASHVCVAFEVAAGRLEVVAGSNPLEGLIRHDTQDLGKTVLRLEKPVVVTRSDEGSEYPFIVEALKEARLESVAVFPIMDEATPIGVTAAFFGRERALTLSDTEVALSVSRQASLVLTRLRAQHQLAHTALHDHLTGLANRAFVRENIALGLAAAATSASSLSVMFIDLDGFKAVNDNLGHHAGDAILREVANRLTASVRVADFAGRYGGDEFVVICEATGAPEAAAIAERIHRELRRPYAAAEGLPVSASIGIAVHAAAPVPATVDDLIRAADTAMYESKALGRDRTTQVLV